MKIMMYIFISLFTTACIEELPEPTHEGKNTFGCKVDGEIFKPRMNDFKATPVASYIKDDIMMVKGTYSKDGIRKQVEVGVANFRGTGKYKLNGAPGPNSVSFTENYGRYSLDAKVEKLYHTTSQLNGTLNIKYFNSKDQIVSGTFSFVAESPDGRTVKVTDGRFDVSFRDY